MNFISVVHYTNEAEAPSAVAVVCFIHSLIVFHLTDLWRREMSVYLLMMIHLWSDLPAAARLSGVLQKLTAQTNS